MLNFKFSKHHAHQSEVVQRPPENEIACCKDASASDGIIGENTSLWSTLISRIGSNNYSLVLINSTSMFPTLMACAAGICLSWIIPAVMIGLPRVLRLGFPTNVPMISNQWLVITRLLDYPGAFGLIGGVAAIVCYLFISKFKRPATHLLLAPLFVSFLAGYFRNSICGENPFQMAQGDKSFVLYYFSGYLVQYGMFSLIGGLSALTPMVVFQLLNQQYSRKLSAMKKTNLLTDENGRA